MKKYFYQSPVSEQVHEGKTIQLICTPVDSTSEVIWHKDGREIQLASSSHQRQLDDKDEDYTLLDRHPKSFSSILTDGNLIISSDGSLIISSTRFSDSGNYTCEARRGNYRRFTKPAHITVYVNGGWSVWSSWEGSCELVEDCPVLRSQLAMNRGEEVAIQRILSRQRRTRVCNNPVPLNGGKNCKKSGDDDEEFKMCEHSCRIDGSWSQWTPWSLTCNDLCQRNRRRYCTAPAPSNGGSACFGIDLQWTNCTANSNTEISDDGLSQFLLPSHCYTSSIFTGQRKSMETNDESFKIDVNDGLIYPKNQTLMFGSISFIFLVALIFFLAKLFRRTKKSRYQSGISLKSEKTGVIFFENGLKKLNGVVLPNERLENIQRRGEFCGYSFDFNGKDAKRCYSAIPYSSKKPMLAVKKPFKNDVVLPISYFTQGPRKSSLASSHSYTLKSAISIENDCNDFWCQKPEHESRYRNDFNGTSCRKSMLKKHYQFSTFDKHCDSRSALIPIYSSSTSSSCNSANDAPPLSNIETAAPSFIGQNITKKVENADEELYAENYATLYDYIIGDTSSAAGTASVSSKFEEAGGGCCTTPDSSSAQNDKRVALPPSSNSNINKMSESVSDAGSATMSIEAGPEQIQIDFQRSGVSVLIGERCFSRRAIVCFTVFDCPQQFVLLENGETCLSSVVSFDLCEAETTTNLLQKPVVLTIEHCASHFSGNDENAWTFMLYVLKRGDYAEKWLKVSEFGPFDDHFFKVGHRKFYIMTSSFGRFLLVGKPSMPGVDPQKRIRPMIFWTPPLQTYDRVPFCKGEKISDRLPQTNHLESLRIYCVPEMSIVIDNIYKKEMRNNGILLAEAKDFTVQECGSFCCLLEMNMQNGNGSTCFKKYREIYDFEHKWFSPDHIVKFSLPAHPSFSYLFPFLGRITICQKCNTSQIRVLELSQPMKYSAHLTTLTKNIKFIQLQLPSMIKENLAKFLDVQFGWQKLALKFGLECGLKFFSSRPLNCSPTLMILDFWEATINEPEKALSELVRIFNVLEHRDSAFIVDKLISTE